MQWLQCIFTDNCDSSFCFWVFEKRLTQENCFLFCKSMVCLKVLFFLQSRNFYCPTFQTFIVQCYRITHIHNYHSFHFTTILWKILYLIFFGHIKADFVRYLVWIYLKSQGARYWIGRSAWLVYMSYLLSLRAWNYHVINISDLFIRLVWKLERACVKAFRNDFVWFKYFLIDSCQHELSTRILLWFNQW